MGRKLSDDELKIRIAIEAFTEDKTIRQLANKYGKSDSTIRRYKDHLKEIFSRNSLPDRVNLDCRMKESETLVSLLKMINEKTDPQESIMKPFKKLKMTSANAEFLVAIGTGFLATITLILALITAWMSCSTEKMAEATRDYVEFYKYRIPTLEIDFFIKCKFDMKEEKDKEGKIKFKVGDYESAGRTADFYLAIKNKWHRIVEGYIEMRFKINAYTEKGDLYNPDPWVSQVYRTENFKIPKGDTEQIYFKQSEIQSFILDILEKDYIESNYVIEIAIIKDSIKFNEDTYPNIEKIRYRKHSEK